MDRAQAIRAIRDAADLPALCQETIKLRKQGTGWMGGPCPAHGGGARTPCISVQPDKGTWHCFTCGEGGDAFDWLGKVHGMDFETALEEMSRRTGIELPPREQKPANPGEERAVQALQAAQDFYEAALEDNYEARLYLEERGIAWNTIKEEGIGYAPAGWDTTVRHLQDVGFGIPILEATGIGTRSQRGTTIDFLRDRITVPIRDARGRVIAFGGRVMPGAPADSPKYMNTKESPLFKKSETVFHLNRAKGFLRSTGAVLVEGYFDVISLCAQGVQEAVAPMGTAITEAHLQALRRWTNRLTLLMDGDGAGQRAADKAMKLALPAGFEVRILTLPTEHDPDTWARELKSEAKTAILSAPDWASFAIDRAKEGKDLRRMEDRLKAAHEVAEWIAYLPSQRQEEVTLAAAMDLKVPPQSLKPQEPQKGTRKPDPAPRRVVAQPDDAVSALVAMAAKAGPYLDWIRNIPQGWWAWREGAGVLETILDTEGNTDDLEKETQVIVRGCCAKAQAAGQVDPKRLHVRLEKEFIQREMAALIQQLAQAGGNNNQITAYQQHLVELRARMARITRGGGR